MTKKEKELIEHLLGYLSDGCQVSKPEKYDGWDCAGMPIKEWPLEKWCSGCLVHKIRQSIK